MEIKQTNKIETNCSIFELRKKSAAFLVLNTNFYHNKAHNVHKVVSDATPIRRFGAGLCNFFLIAGLEKAASKFDDCTVASSLVVHHLMPYLFDSSLAIRMICKGIEYFFLFEVLWIVFTDQ